MRFWNALLPPIFSMKVHYGLTINITLTLTQACPILSTCSSRESSDATRTSRKTMVTSGSICSSRDMVFFQ